MCDIKSLEFFEKRSDMTQFVCVLNKPIQVTVWGESTEEARLEAAKPGRIFHKSNLEIVVAIQVVRIVKF